MLRVAALVTLTGVVVLATGFVGSHQTGRAADDEPGVRVPVQTAAPPPQSEGSGVLVEVRRGDHMWKISARHIRDAAPERRVAPYWRRVVEINTPRVRSGDPDLIYPGESILMPELNGPP